MEIFKITKRLDRDVIFIKKGYFWVRTLSVGLLLFFMLIGCTTIVPKSELEYSPIYSNPSLVKNKSMMIKVCKIQDFWVRAGYFTSTLKSTVVIEMKLSNQNGNELLLSEGKGEHSAFFRGGDVKKDMTESLRKSFQEALEDCLIKLYMFLATT